MGLRRHADAIRYPPRCRDFIIFYNENSQETRLASHVAAPVIGPPKSMPVVFAIDKPPSARPKLAFHQVFGSKKPGFWARREFNDYITFTTGRKVHCTIEVLNVENAPAAITIWPPFYPHFHF